MSAFTDMPTEQRDHLREALCDEALMAQFLKVGISDFAAEHHSSDNYAEWLYLIYTANVSRVCQFAESPIEKMFLNSLQIHGIKNGLWFSVLAPCPDLIKAINDFSQRFTGVFRCQHFYRSLPDNARPASFQEFLAAFHNPSPSPEEIEGIKSDALLACDLGMMHMPFIALQPSWPKFIGGKGIRPDAVVFVPSLPSVRIVIECDGFDTHDSRETFISDRKRDRLLNERGFSVRRYSGSEIYVDPITAPSDLVTHLINTHQVGIPQQKKWERRIVKNLKPPIVGVAESWMKWLAQEARV